MAAKSIESAARRTFRGGAPLSVSILAVLAGGAGCGQEFTSCSETRSCGEQGGTSGAGASGGSGGSVSGGAGTSGASGAPSEDCPDGCDEDETCCDGECVDTSSDAAHCGSCGNACRAAHAESQCVDSECSIESCTKGYVDCSSEEDGCETEDEGLPGAPAPLLPMAGAYTGAVRAESSLKPKFAWQVPETDGSCGGLTYELELTRECEPGKLQDCAFVEPDVTAAGLELPEFSPEDPLPVSEDVPVGAFYAWRVRACDAPERCSEWSRVSYVHVGRLIDDINADGYSDLVEVGEDEEVSGMLLRGDGATPLAANAAIEAEIGAPTHGRLLGDVNGDAFPDMVLWSTELAEPPRVILGASTPAGWTSAVMTGALQSRHRAGRAGDLDGDGFADVAISEFDLASDGGTARGVVRLYRGRAELDLVGPVNVVPPDGTTSAQFGAALEGGFDSNADGYADLFVMDDDEGRLHLLRGKTSLPSSIDASIQSSSLIAAVSHYSDLIAVGDLNGDGYQDIGATVRRLNDLAIQIFSGGAEPSSEPLANIVLPSAYVALEWAGGVDLGTDGRADLVLHEMESLDAASRIAVLPGSAQDQTVDDLVGLANFQTTQFFRLGVTRGDYDGDGAWDIAFGAMNPSLTLLRGGKPAPKSEICAQSTESLPLIGDWCSVENVSIATPAYSGTAVR
jgi:hypothetical protein